MRVSERAAALKRIEILAKLPEASIARLAQHCRWRDYAAGEQILGFDDTSTDVLFLVHGKGRVVIYSADGKAVVFVDLAPTSMFGEIAAMDRKPRSASVEALEDCTVAALSADEFEDLLRQEPDVAIATLRHVAADVRRLSERVFEFSTMLVQNRIHAELVRLAGETGRLSGEVSLSPAPSLSELAGRISSHREAVSRELSRLTNIGLLRRERGDLIITDIAKLGSLVDAAKGE